MASAARRALASTTRKALSGGTGKPRTNSRSRMEPTTGGRRILLATERKAATTKGMGTGLLLANSFSSTSSRNEPTPHEGSGQS